MDENDLFDAEAMKDQFRKLGIDVDRILNDKKLSALAEHIVNQPPSTESPEEWAKRLGEQMASAGEYYEYETKES